MPERFLPIPGYEGYYTVSDRGRIWSIKREQFIVAHPTDGYLRVCLYKNGVEQRHTVHILVACVFIGPPDGERNFVNHKDCNKLNNRVSNLEWVTALENTHHALNNGRGQSQKLTIKQVRQILQLSEVGFPPSF